MGSRNRYDGVDEYAIKLIRRVARKLVGRYGIKRRDQEDLEQELMLDLHRRLPKYDPRLSSRRTFIDRVVNHKVADMVESRRAGKRDYRRCTCSLNDELVDDEGDSTERVETFDQDDYLMRTGRASHAEAELHDLQIDLDGIIASLPADCSELCRRLMSDNASEVARDMGVSRHTVHRRLKRIRGLFEIVGLGEYLG